MTKRLLFQKPRQLEYVEHFRPGMGTEAVAPFLRSMVQLVRPSIILEVGAGYTTPFLLEAIVNNEIVFNDGNLDLNYFENYTYDPKLIIIDDMSLGDLINLPGMNEIVNSRYTRFIEGFFQGQAAALVDQYGTFDFVWFDCGGEQEYKDFMAEYWDYCTGYVFFHFTYSSGVKNLNYAAIMDKIKDEPFVMDIIEPHKTRQGSITMVKRCGSQN